MAGGQRTRRHVPEQRAGYATTGELEPLDGYLQADRFDLADFYPRLLDLFNYQGSYYGLPRDNDTKVIYYNRTMFADARPVATTGWLDLDRLAK